LKFQNASWKAREPLPLLVIANRPAALVDAAPSTWLISSFSTATT